MSEGTATARELRIARAVKLVLALTEHRFEIERPSARPAGIAAAWQGIAEGCELISLHATYLAERIMADPPRR